MRKCKTVSFDINDAFERELLQHAEANGKFSKYIKRLIQKDKEGLQPEPQFNVVAADDEDDAIDTFF